MPKRKAPSKETQIKMIRGALASKKTPKVFLPSLRKRLAKLTAVILFALAFGAAPASAQFIGYTSPQTVQQKLANNVPCTGGGGQQIFVTQNLGQTQHYASAIVAHAANLQMEIDGIDSLGDQIRISDVLVQPTAQRGYATRGSGYYPITEVIVTCQDDGSGMSAFSVSYSGTSSTPDVNAGSYALAQNDKIIFAGSPEATSAIVNFQPPYMNTGGMIYFNYPIAAIANSTITVQCISVVSTISFNSQVFAIANATGVQTFMVPPQPCFGLERISYGSGGGGANIFNLDYIFTEPGFVNSTLGAYTHVTGTTATAAKATAGTFLGITLNTSAAGTITVTDLATAGCTGTPATNIVAVLTIAATEIARAIPFNVAMQNGVCVKASVAMDFTVGSQ